MSSVQPCDVQARGHVVDQGGQRAIGHGYLGAGDDERPSVGTITPVLIEKVRQSRHRGELELLRVAKRVHRGMDHVPPPA